MFDNSRLKRIEIIAIACALFAAGILSGYFIGKGVGPKTVSIEVSESAKSVNESAPVDKGETEVKTDNLVKKVNINTATNEELCALPGIGEVLSDRIITYRSEVGKFDKIEDIMKVHGIGTSIYESIKDYIFV